MSQAAEDIAQAVAAAARAAEASEAAQQDGDAAGDGGGQIVVSAGILRTSHRGSASADERQLGPVEERVLYGIAGAPLMAAGLLLALGRHRRRQLWNRVGGRRPSTPTGDAAVAEESIRVGAGEVEVWFLDLALRGLAAELAKRGRALPRAHALRLRAQGIELMLAETSEAAETANAADTAEPTGPDQAPLPWFDAADGKSWNFPRAAIGQLDAEAAHQRFAPYPGLVSLGTAGRDGEDRILIDLEDTPGVLAVAGPREQTRALISAMAVELATNAWSDRMSITLVGFPGDLTPLAPARVRHVKVLDEVLPMLEAEAAERAEALSSAGLESVLDSRVRATHAASFAPHFVLIAEEPSAELLERLVRIAPSSTRVGMGFVVVGDVAGAAGRLVVSGDGMVRESRVGGLEATGPGAAGGSVCGDPRPVPGRGRRRGRAAQRGSGRRGTRGRGRLHRTAAGRAGLGVRPRTRRTGDDRHRSGGVRARPAAARGAGLPAPASGRRAPECAGRRAVAARHHGGRGQGDRRAAG